MPATVAVAIVVLLLAVVTMALLAIFAPRLFDQQEYSAPAETAPIATILDRIADEGSLRYDSWQLEPSHRHPIEPYTVEQAHQTMQRHRMCSADTCPAKSAAMYSLESAKRTRFDERAVR
ncbi:hypothetical protein [Nocardia brasiliensis]|uniref:hypothetical protein n=1 Tax=Nocardia brasiliensis TaxID=37326 RepID=UPI00245422D9|nr:hypothetical protein [Nocardia brasiliensis]